MNSIINIYFIHFIINVNDIFTLIFYVMDELLLMKTNNLTLQRLDKTSQSSN